MRHKKAPQRDIAPDPVYKSVLVAKLINHLMKDGKKTVAEKLVYDTFSLLKEQGDDPLAIFEKAMQSVGPKQEVKARRVGGASYQIPIDVRGERRVSLAMRWIINAATARPSKQYHTFAQKLAAELKDASENRGDAIKKRDVMQKMADANRAFSHFRF